VINPTRVARTSEVEARITVAQRFPASREMVENRAEAKARARPTRDSRNLTQTSALADCSHRASRLGKVELESNGLVRAEPTGRSLAFRMGTHNREALAEKAFVTWLGRCRGWRRGFAAAVDVLGGAAGRRSARGNHLQHSVRQQRKDD